MGESSGTDGIYDADEALRAFVEHARSDETVFPLGYSIDQLGTPAAGDLCLMWARSGTGKSTWMLNVITRTPTIPTVVFNMEMPPKRQIEWALSMANTLEVPAREVMQIFRDGVEDDYPELKAAMRDFPVRFPSLTFVHPKGKPSVDELIRKCDDVYDRKGVRPLRVFIDHLTLLKNCNGSKEAVEAVTSRLHEWAQRDDITVFAIQQTGRSSGDGSGGRNDGHIPVTLTSGVYGGDSDADYVYGMYQPAKDPKYTTPEGRDSVEYARVKGVTRLQLVKNRPNGELSEQGLKLSYEPHSRRLMEEGERWPLPS